MYQDLNAVQRDVLLQCLLAANHKPKKWEWQGKIFECKAGQFITSLDSLTKLCANGTSIQNIRTALVKLEKWEFLTNESTKTGRLITVINWDTYQNCEDDTNKGINKELTKSQQSSNKELTTNKNVKKDKNEKKETIHIIFEFWNNQGITKHKTIDKSKPSINSAIKEYSEDEIKKAIINYNTILNDTAYYWTHKWTLKEFLQRGMDKFRDENKPFDNYKADKKGGNNGKHTGLNEKDYSEGIAEDGSF